MAVTKPVSLSKIVAEFGGPGNLAAYVRGGSWVPNSPANAAISTTVAGLSLSQFEGASKSTPLSGFMSTITGLIANPNDPQPPSSMTVSAGGSVTVTGGSGNYTYNWSILSGRASISGSATGRNVTISALVRNWITDFGEIRCVVSDGTSSITIDGSYTLRYESGRPI